MSDKSRLDVIEERRQELKELNDERLKKIENFYRMASIIKLNEDTKSFFKLAYELYGEDIVYRIRKATNLSLSEKDSLIGKFDLLHQLIIPFIND